ncbi:protein-L-isoaspartate(D-aspartate) O-methyltransferase [Fidelibacter multiformis]|jgi:protein-L-isoaspartate(D-aspartate) O-methyltransferase|uniref:protein-L-isoaspartate(D-aspartate) O-methyltransferase n=1 Tax=Fidelibacter multiformis TaxID=3377529 RepID=UPI0037DDDE3A
MKIWILFFLLMCQVFLFGEDYDRAREEMVRYQLENRDIKNKVVLNTMKSVPRHEFVPDKEKRNAYDDRPLPIGYGQTISQPYIVAYMTQVIDPKPEYRILEIGTGSGYQAAVLAEIADSVFTIEIVKGLADRAQSALEENGYANVVIRHGDGYYGWESKAPFDAIVVTAAAEHIPPPLIKQLKPDGKMIIPVGSPFMIQNLMLVEKKGESVRTTSLFPVRFVPLTREPR